MRKNIIAEKAKLKKLLPKCGAGRNKGMFSEKMAKVWCFCMKNQGLQFSSQCGNIFSNHAGLAPKAACK